jgi:hypothetical protein
MTGQDKYMPTFDIREHHQLTVRARAEEAYAAMRRVDFSRSRLVRAIFGIRTLPGYFRGQPWGTPKGAFVDQALAMGWVILEESLGHEFVAGAVTQPWAPIVRFVGVPTQDFLAFAEPGFVKIVWGFSAQPSPPDNALLATETRARATDPASRDRFLRYWLFVSPGIRIIRRVALKLAQRDLKTVRNAA